jgi:hypothetical protein
MWDRDRHGHPSSPGTLVCHSDAGSQGGLNRSSQHLDQEVFGGATCRVDGYSDGQAGDAVPGKATDPPRSGAGVLGEDRPRDDERGRCRRVRRVGAGRVAVVPRTERYAVVDSHPTFRPRYLSFAEREELALLRARDLGVRAIARELGRSPATISRELRRNAATRAGRLEYRASVAQWKAELMAQRPKTAKLLANPNCVTTSRTACRVCCVGSASFSSVAHIGRHRDFRPRRAGLEGAKQAASPRPKVVDGVEPGADRESSTARLP